jgi:hypothetical protein
VAREIELPAEFTPLRSASRLGRILIFVAGPLLWLVSVVVVGLVVHRGGAVELGLAVTLIGFFVSLLVSANAHRLRRRDEREAAEEA